MKKVIFIDWNKTLSHSLFWEHLRGEEHPNHKYFEAMNRWLFTDNKDLITPWMRGELSVDNITERMGQETEIGSSIVSKELQYSCEQMQYSINGLENIIAKIRSKGMKVVIATDNMDTFTKYTIPAMKLNDIFDDIPNSYDMGYLKDDIDPPDKIPFFDEYLERNGWTYRDAVLLDDSPDTSGKYANLDFNRVLIDSSEKFKTILEHFTHER